MTSADVNSLTDKLSKTSVDNDTISFAGKGFKLDTEDDGKTF